MIWSVLIATHISRSRQFSELAAQLGPQLTADIEVVVYWNRGRRVIGEYRQALVEEATGEYVSFIDDDDRIPSYYCSAIIDALVSRPDYVGFEMVYQDHSPSPRRLGPRAPHRVFHSLQYDGWYQRRGIFYRDVSHLNPVRRDLALKATFNGSAGEDRRWADQLRPHLNSEVYISRPMYFYDYNRASSHKEPLPKHGPRPGVLPAGFRYHPDSEL